MAITVSLGKTDDYNVHTTSLDPVLVSAEQTRMLYRQLWFALVFTAIIAPILCAFLWSAVDHAVILMWLSIVVVVSSGRLILGLRYQYINPAAAEAEHWYRWFLIGTALAGSAWGSAGVLLFPEDSLQHLVFLGFVVSGMAAGAVNTQSYAWTPILVFLLLCILPFALRLFLEATPLGYAMATMALLYLLGLSMVARRAYTNNLQNVVLRLEATRREEAINHFKLTLDQIHDCVFMIDPDSLRCLYVNRGAILQLGYDRDELLRLMPVEIDPEHSEADYRAMCTDLIEKREHSITFETRYKHKSGQELIVEMILQYVKPIGHQGRLVAVVRNISQRKQVEQDLIKARDAAQVAAQAKSRFLATMSHEIRTPMNGVLGMAELLSHTPLDARQQRQVETIRSSATLLINLINDILDFSRIDAGKLELRYEAFDLELAISEVVNLIAPQIRTKDLIMDIRYAPKLPRNLVGDEHYIRQVLMNLVGNAIKFTDSGQIQIVVNGVADGTEASLRIEVRDTGIGIDAGSRDHLFGLFTQADGSHSRNFGGTGLGLAISHALIKLMGGKIGVESELGAGSTFWIELKLPVGTEPFAIADGRLANLAALLVGSESSYMETLAIQLAEQRLECVRANDCQLASDTLRQAQISGRAIAFMFVDAYMPIDERASLVKTAKQRFVDTALFLLMPLGHDFSFDENDDAVANLVVPTTRSALAKTLVRQLKQATLAQALESDAESSSTTTASACCGRILMAEDNLVNREVAIDMLEELGFEVVTAENGQQAIAQYHATKPDLVLMDGQMPKIDGYEATRRLRRDEQESGTHVPIVAMTAHAFPEDRRKCMSSGMDDYLAKPFTIENLNEVLCRWLKTKEHG
ncbi:MAG: response regulator [Gammaproteobacteria bacterium]|nr:response regulator [Gammaproteobacteria bacterium]NNJ97278.1 response regulator [Gammaproteobacteria bacterium]